MSDCTTQGDSTQGVLFQGLLSKPLAVEFDAERLSDFGGLPLLVAADRRLGLTEALAAVLRDPRVAERVSHSDLDLLRQRIYGLAVGLEDVNDAARMRDDPAVRLALGRPAEGADGALASAPSLCRFENRVGPRDALRLGDALLRTVLAGEARRRRGRATRITLDLDPADDPTHGGQQLSFFNGHYDTWCYLPLFAFVTFHDAHGREEPEQHLVAAVLRPGNAPATLGARGVLLRLVAELRRLFPGTPLRARLDGGFAGGEFLDWLDALGLEYVVNLPKNSVLEPHAAPLLERAREASAASGRSERVYGEGAYAAQTWKRSRRVIVKAEVVRDPGRPQQGPRDNPRFAVTNLRQSPEHVYEAVYCRRGEVENRIKELKDGMRVDRTSCTGFWANQMRVLLTAAAYVLMQELRRHAARTSLARCQVGALRERLLRLAARVVTSTRRFLFRLSRAGAWNREWRAVARSLGAVPG